MERSGGMSVEKPAKKKILFVCIGNMCRSQMAEGFARALGGNSVEVYSAGTNHTGLVSAEAIAVMDEKGIDISDQYSKGLEDVPLTEMDYIVSMANRSANELCPPSFQGERIDWRVEDPIGGSKDAFRIIRDDLGERIKQLLESIWKGKPASA